MNPNRKPYLPAITPRLRILLRLVFVLTALLGANSVYLAAVTVLESIIDRTYQNFFYQYMFLGHLVLGLLLIAPFLTFGVLHIRNAWRRKNRRAVWMGYFLFGSCLVLIVSGLLLARAGPLEIRDARARGVFYWVHVVAPLVAVWLYCLHRLAGPPIKWRYGLGYLGLVASAGAVALMFHHSDPRGWYQVGSGEGAQYFEPSLARTAGGKFIPETALANDSYCQECHADAHEGWAQSAHRFSSFNNPAYLASVRETREFSLKRDGNVQRSRWCAGCHDPVPFFSGAFDDPEFDDVGHSAARAGITCTVCHAITHINSVRGNADYTIEEPLHYPFAYSENPVLKWINRQLVKAKPSFHKKTFLKPFHREAEFCAACHKVHLPVALNDYKFLRGQNHYDTFLLSGVSGHGARSFYYPPKAESSCNGCHMPLVASDDFAARKYPEMPGLSVHDHLFPGANTALPYWRDKPEVVAAQEEFLDAALRVDIFGVRDDGRIDGHLVAPLRPQVPLLEPGRSYLIETVIRTLELGHHFTQGTADSNEVWLAVTATSGGQVVGSSGQILPTGEVDPWAHFVNVFMLDRNGRRIDRRNAQDIFVPLYDHQIPPGAAQTVHYGLQIPPDLEEHLVLEVKLQFRKFDQTYLEFIAARRRQGDPPVRGLAEDGPVRNQLPVTTLSSDRIVLPVAGIEATVPTNSPRKIPAWQRWNDYGIGLLLQGKSELRQAEEAFVEVECLGRYDGPLNLARVLLTEGRLDEAVDAIRRAARHDDPPPPSWTLAWLSGQTNLQQGHLEEAEENFRSVLSVPTEAMRDRGFDFRRDYEVRNLLGQTLFDRARRQRRAADGVLRAHLLNQSVAQFEKTLELDPENVTAHYNLQRLHASLGNDSERDRHQQAHLLYKVDDNARGQAVAAARARYPAANHAAAAVVIYDLQRER